jgi:hypothetical protein
MHTKTKVGLTKTHFSMLLMNVAIVELSKATWGFQTHNKRSVL